LTLYNIFNKNNMLNIKYQQVAINEHYFEIVQEINVKISNMLF